MLQEVVLNVLILEVELKLVMVCAIKIKIIKMLIVLANNLEMFGNGNAQMEIFMDIVLVKVLYHMETLDMEIQLKQKSQDKFKSILLLCVILEQLQFHILFQVNMMLKVLTLVVSQIHLPLEKKFHLGLILE